MTEATLMREIQVAASRAGYRLFRNNVGTGWTGHVLRFAGPASIMMYPGDIVIREARPLHAGLCKGSSDLIGWRTVTITEEMIGQAVALFLTVEVKNSSGRLTTEQQAFLKTVNGAGGIAVVARSVEEALRGMSGEGT